MRKQLGGLSAGILLLVFAFSGCAYMTKTGRQQMAYRHYVNKHIRQNQRRIARAQKKANRDLRHKLSFIPPRKSIISASAESAGPTSDPGAPAPPVAGEEPVTIPGP
jgi:hypothetical protein